MFQLNQSQLKAYTAEERREYIGIIHSYITFGIKILCEKLVAQIPTLLDAGSVKNEIVYLRKLDRGTSLNKITAHSIKTMWNNIDISSTRERFKDCQFYDSISYFISRIDDIMSIDYLPTDNDILHTHTELLGIVTERYSTGNTVYEMYDISNQKNEKKKWIHYFEGVSVIVYIVSLACYDERIMVDGESTNSMVGLQRRYPQ